MLLGGIDAAVSRRYLLDRHDPRAHSAPRVEIPEREKIVRELLGGHDEVFENVAGVSERGGEAFIPRQLARIADDARYPLHRRWIGAQEPERLARFVARGGFDDDVDRAVIAGLARRREESDGAHGAGGDCMPA
jgi:hypothetical protein